MDPSSRLVPSQGLERLRPLLELIQELLLLFKRPGVSKQWDGLQLSEGPGVRRGGAAP